MKFKIDCNLLTQYRVNGERFSFQQLFSSDASVNQFELLSVFG